MIMDSFYTMKGLAGEAVRHLAVVEDSPTRVVLSCDIEHRPLFTDSVMKKIKARVRLARGPRYEPGAVKVTDTTVTFRFDYTL